MKTGPKGIALIKKYESLRLVAYKPVSSEEFWTIGWGHYGPDVKPGMVWTKAAADAAFVHDLVKREAILNSALHIDVSQDQFDAMMSLLYNIGEGNFHTSSVLRFTNQKNFDAAAASFRLWNKGGFPPHIMTGLVTRRAEEEKLYRGKL